MTLKELNKAVCGLVKRAAEASGLGAELMAEDLSAPIQRPSLKVELEEDRDARAHPAPGGAGHHLPGLFLRSGSVPAQAGQPGHAPGPGGGISGRGPVGEETVPIDEGLSFTVTDGVLVASMDLTLDQRIIPAEEEDAELMEELNVNLEVH